ncbi:MAG: conjugal transfer protein TraI [Flavobacteriia bacterium]|nr:conjugal transfer protein TraI [Flavobacteriia bacterium]OJX36578.1 MAG: conjugal transfer protein TraI [Flavobacteriia bacterium 40-80]
MKTTVKKIIMWLAFIVLMVVPIQNAQAGIIEIVKQIVTMAIKAADLAIQKKQNKVIVLQNAQKKIENEMSKRKLREISDWTKKQKEQYEKYFEELRKVKSVISNYKLVKDMLQKQLRMVEEHKKMWQLIRSDGKFTKDEIKYMEGVYDGMLKQSLQNINQIRMVISSYTTKMSDGKRLELINSAARELDRSYDDMKRFNTENAMLRLSRAKDQEEIEKVKSLYGIH